MKWNTTGDPDSTTRAFYKPENITFFPSVPSMIKKKSGLNEIFCLECFIELTYLVGCISFASLILDRFIPAHISSW